MSGGIEVLSGSPQPDPGAVYVTDPETAHHSALPARAPTERFAVTWRPVPGFPAHEVNLLGWLRNATTGHARNPSADADGYLFVTLTAPATGKKVFCFVHRLVMLAFGGPPPTPQHQVAHLDGIRQNNAAWNLRWATAAENAADRRRHSALRKHEAELRAGGGARQRVATRQSAERSGTRRRAEKYSLQFGWGKVGRTYDVLTAPLDRAGGCAPGQDGRGAAPGPALGLPTENRIAEAQVFRRVQRDRQPGS